jgi:hypothetical protein
LQKLGLTASSIPLTNKFSIPEFDYSNGYVDVLGDLLISESYFGYLDTNEVLQIRSLAVDAGIGSVYSNSDIIDISQINSGELPGETVTVSYSTLRLKSTNDENNPEPVSLEPQEEVDIQERFWEFNKVIAGPNYYTVGNLVYSGTEVTETYTTYERVNKSDVPVLRITKEFGRPEKIYGSIGTQFEKIKSVNLLGELPKGFTLLREESETTEYDYLGEKTRTRTIVYEPVLAIVGSLDLEYVYTEKIDNVYVTYGYSPSNGNFMGLVPTSEVVSVFSKSGNFQQQITSEYKLWPYTIPGQQSIAASKDLLRTIGAVRGVIEVAINSGTVHARTTATINEVGEVPKRPDNLLNGAYNKDQNANSGNNWRVENVAELSLALGSATAQRRIELSMPHAPDDTFFKVMAGGTTLYYSVRSDAAAKAVLFGRIQNKLLLGNRNGMSLQLAPERLPSEPFAPMYIQANGLTALYRANGNQWAFDSNGIVCSTDALFWAAVGGTGDFWFPVAPGIVTLPETPPIVDGEMEPPVVILPYNETVICHATVRSEVSVRAISYGLNLLTEVPPLQVNTKIEIESIFPAAASTFALSGKDATLKLVSSVLPSLAGAFSLGQTEALFYPAVMTSDTGSFALTGKDVVLDIPFGIFTGTAAPSLGSTGIPSYQYAVDAGWTWLEYNENIDDGVTNIYTLPFPITIDSVANSYLLSVSTNTYVTFDAYSSEGTGLSEFYPPLPKIFLGADDNSMQAVLKKITTARDGSDVIRLRYEGTAAASGTPGSPNIVFEISFYEPRLNGEQWIEVRVGVHARTGGLFMLAGESTNYVSSTIEANSSWVFVGNSTGTTWTLTSNRYIP